LSHPLSRLQAALADRYRIERELGRGGMAVVYLAHDLRHDRPVALKVLHPELAATLGPDRFLREIKFAARLQHPHILSVHESGEADGQLWFTMPFVEGETLRSRLARERQLPIGEALRIAIEVADALQYAHQHGVIHRDIKPENVLLGSGHALVADFGIARVLGGEAEEKLTQTGFTLGTPQYMSPEQATGDRALDERSDVYSLGCVVYEMLAGEPPFSGPTPQAVLAKRLTEPLPRLGAIRDVPRGVERAVNRALARAPADRFATAAEFGGALEATPAEGTGETKTATATRRPKRLARAAPLAGALALLLLGGYFLLPNLRAGGHAPLASAAVLPFRDLSPGQDQEYFSDGLTEELITSLSQVKGLRVAARTSSFQFKGRNPDISEVGRKLDVGAVLEGSVRKSGNRLRISAQLISVKDGYQLWSNSYDRDLADVFAVQEGIARSIVGALRVRLAPGPDSALAARPTQDLQAYDLYLKGRFAWNQRTDLTLKEAVRYLEQAVARDPDFARAWAGLADAYILVVPYAGGSPAATWQKAKAAAARALALDSASAEAHTSLAYGSMIYEWDWSAAEQSFRRAIAADSNYATGHHWYGDFLAGRGRFDESLREMQRAHQLDPLSRQIGVELGWVYYLMHRSDEALNQVRQVLALDPNYAQAHFRIGLIQIQQKHYTEAIESLRRALELGGFYPHISAGLALAYAFAGDRTQAMGVLQDMERKRAAGQYVPSFAIAVAYGALGQRSRGIEWLLRAIDEKDIFVPENFYDPLLDPLRVDRRFAGITARMGLSNPPSAVAARDSV
jgi:eukaryotic-like serine/threonine-protein kinase